MRLSRVPAVDTALKLSAVAVAMFAFVFVVMVPLYSVLCDALGINGTPAFVINEEIHPGALSEDRLRELVAKARGPKAKTAN